MVDPLDGTTPFVSGLEYWGVSIGLLKNQKPFLGAIYIPKKNWLFSAGEGKGSFLNGKPIAVSANKDLSKAVLGFDLGHKGARELDVTKSILPLINEVRYMPCFACATLGQALVATGVYDAYIHHRAFPWDLCAGTIIVQEARGKVTDHEGNPLDWTKKENMSVLASNGLLHKEILRAIQKK